VSIPAAPGVRGSGWAPYAAVAGLFLVIKLVVFASMQPIGDEAYYWLWGQHLDLSYFDHPPFHAWLQSIMSLLLGWNLWSLRALTWLTFGSTVWIFWLWSKRLAPEDRLRFFWQTTALYLAVPLFLGMSSIVFNDHLMMALVVASAHFMLVFTESWEEQRPRWSQLYLSTLLLGLAVLTKYNAVFLGFAYLFWFIARPTLRGLLRRWQTYGAAALSVLLQAPVLYWNLSFGFASYRFHFTDRWTRAFDFSLVSIILFCIVAMIVVSPFFIAGMIRLGRVSPQSGFEQRLRGLALATFSVSSVCMLVLASFAEVFFYWNIVAFLLLVPLLVRSMQRFGLFWLHAAYGMTFGLLMLYNQYVQPIGNAMGSYDWTISSTYGWSEIAERVAAAEAERDVGFVGSTFYTTAAQLGFMLKNKDVVAISPRPDEFDIWFEAEAHRGENAIIVADSTYPIDYAAQQFESVEPIETVQVKSFGNIVYEPTIYYAKNYRPPQSP
jgi:4-amino-4-deoxy-L-arabinose transferase-like glycosyltransferase